MQWDGERVNEVCINGMGISTLGTLHEDMIPDDINSAGGTVTSIASNCSVGSTASIGRQKSLSRKSSLASQPAMEAVNEYVNGIGDINDSESTAIQPIDTKKSNKKDRKKREKKRSPRSDPDGAGTIAAVSKRKKRRTKSLRKKSIKKKDSKKEKKRKSSKSGKRKKSTENVEEEEDSLDLRFEDLVPSSASSADSEAEWADSTDSEDNGQAAGRLDGNGKYIEHNGVADGGGSNNLRHYVELKVVKYPGTGELYLIITRFDEERDAMEVFRTDFAHCVQIEKCEVEEDFAVCFESVMIIFRADDYEKARSMLINLRMLLEQHSVNIQPELPPPPEATVTDQMNLFFGGF